MLNAIEPGFLIAQASIHAPFTNAEQAELTLVAVAH